MKGIEVSKKHAEKVLSYVKNKYIDARKKIIKENDVLKIPVKEDFNLKKAEGISKIVKMLDADFPEKEVKKNFKTEVEKILNKDEKEMLKTAYDIIGSIAVLEIDEQLHGKASDIAEKLLECNSNIKTVVRKKGKHEGQLRLQDYEILAGEKTLFARHKENGCVINVELNKVYYSPRSATERKRVMKLVKPKEKVLVMFSGCGPFICMIAKNSDAKYVCGIELNKDGHKLALKNIKENKLPKADSICGDVRAICPQLKEEGVFFDRIVMPLPKTAEEFLPEAFLISKPGTVIYLYDFVDESLFPSSTITKIDKYCKAAGKKYEILNSVKCGQFSPSVFRVCIDFKLLN